MASIRDVAKHAGVSIASVSRVLNNDKSFAIKDETRQKIHDAIAELNYKIPEGYIKGNAKKFSIACIQRLTVEGDKDNYYSTIATGIKEHLSSYGKSLEFMFSQFDFDNNNYKKIFNTYPKGLIIMGDISDEAYEFLRSKIKYIVGVGTSYKDIDNIRYNKFHAGVDAVEYLVKCGHKKIAYIGSNYERGNLKELGRYEAYLKVLDHRP